MKTAMYKRIHFVGRSLLWSLLFYVICLVILDWNSLVANIKHEDGNKTYVVQESREHMLPRVTTTIVSPEIEHTTTGVLSQVIKLAGYLIR